MSPAPLGASNARQFGEFERSSRRPRSEALVPLINSRPGTSTFRRASISSLYHSDGFWAPKLILTWSEHHINQPPDPPIGDHRVWYGSLHAARIIKFAKTMPNLLTASIRVLVRLGILCMPTAANGFLQQSLCCYASCLGARYCSFARLSTGGPDCRSSPHHDRRPVDGERSMYDLRRVLSRASCSVDSLLVARRSSATTSERIGSGWIYGAPPVDQACTG